MDALELPSAIDWKQILAIAHNQTLEGVVADAVMRLPSTVKVPTQVRGKIMNTALKIAKSHALLDNKLAEVVSFYQKQGVKTILLKGQGIARCYRNRNIRQCGDIDFYVGKGNYDKACWLAHDKIEKGEKMSYETQNHYHFYIGEVAIDMHHTAASPTTFRGKEFLKWVEAELAKENENRHIEINGVQISMPPVSFDVVFIFYHAWRHLTFGGIGLRQLCDWAMVLNKYSEKIDLASLEQVLRRFRLIKPWQIFGYIIVEYLGLPKEKLPFYNPSVRNKAQIALNLIIEGGNFGFFSSKNVKNREITIVNQKPFLQRNWIKLRKYTNCYMRLLRLIPVEATYDFIKRVPKGCINAIDKLMWHKD